MTTLERNAQLLVAMLFAAALVAICLFAFNVSAPASAQEAVAPTPTPSPTPLNPYGNFAAIDADCKMVADSEEAYRHAYSEGWFHSLPAWEHRHKAFRPIPDGGVTVKISNAFNGKVTASDVTITNELEYRRARNYRNNSQGFLNRGLETMALSDGGTVAIWDGGGHNSLLFVDGGANVKYWFYLGAEPSFDEMRCFYRYGAGLPTPTPAPTGG